MSTYAFTHLANTRFSFPFTAISVLRFLAGDPLFNPTISPCSLSCMKYAGSDIDSSAHAGGPHKRQQKSSGARSRAPPSPHRKDVSTHTDAHELTLRREKVTQRQRRGTNAVDTPPVTNTDPAAPEPFTPGSKRPHDLDGDYWKRQRATISRYRTIVAHVPHKVSVRDK